MEKAWPPPAEQEGCSKPSLSTPAYFLILPQSQGNGKNDEGIVVANRDTSSVAPVVPMGADKSQSGTFLSSECTSGKITVTLDNNNMWNEFFRCSTEMVLTKQGRRMFPYCRYWISGLESDQKYILVMDLIPMANHRYKWNGKMWEPGGRSEPHVLGRVFIHPESPSTGHYWMHQPISFYKLKLTNNVLDQEGHIILHSMHRYLPRLHVVPANKATEVIQLNGPDVHTFTFPQTEFIAVTAYQNFQITQLKIDCNPFAKGFREGAVGGRPGKEPKPRSTDQDMETSIRRKTLDTSESIRKLRELFKSQRSDNGTENEAFNAELDFLNFSGPTSAKPVDEVGSLDGGSGMASPADNKPQLDVVVKEEPEDEYDYSRPVEAPERVAVKEESSDSEVTDEYSNSDDDYPILERQFAQFRSGQRHARKRSLSPPSGVARAKLLKLASGDMPKVYLKQCPGNKNALNEPDAQEPVLDERASHDSHRPDSPSLAEKSLGLGTACIPHASGGKESEKAFEQTPSKDSVTPGEPLTGSKVTTARKRRSPLLPKAKKGPGTRFPNARLKPVKNKRGRPRKHKVKAGRYSKKSSPIEPVLLFRDCKPDLEDVDGVLFVAFSSKEALDVHMGKNPSDVPSIPSEAAVPRADKEEQRKIAILQKQLVADLKKMRHQQVIHPALQQVGLKLNIVDRSLSIDLRYLGVQLPLSYTSGESRLDDYETSAQASEIPFVSRTGKTTDYKKIKGWREKFSTPSSSSRNEATNSENSLKNRSAFCSDELDEYLENEAKLMENSSGAPQKESRLDVSYQLPTKSVSYVKTLDSVLKTQASKQSPPTAKAKSTVSTRRRTNLQRKPPKLPTKAKARKAKKSPDGLPGPPSAGSDQADASLEQSPPQQANVRPHKVSTARTRLPEDEATSEPASRTKERVEQPSLKNKRPHKPAASRRKSSCKKEFCRLGCVCESLTCSENYSDHCRQAKCMFGCVCVKNIPPLATCSEKPPSSQSLSGQNSDGEDLLSDSERPTPADDERECEETSSADHEGSQLETPKKKHFPIWNKADIDTDSEPAYTRVKTEADGDAQPSIPDAQQHGASNNDASSEELDSVSLESMMTCARVRIYERKLPEDQDDLDSSTCNDYGGSEQEQNPKQVRNRSKENEENKRSESNSPTKLIEIMSDCIWEKDRSKILNVVSQHINSKSPQYLKVGSFNIELTSEEHAWETTKANAYCSRVKISLSPEKRAEMGSSRLVFPKWKTESIKINEHKVETKSTEKSHGGKCLPFYTKVIPAGKLIAHRKTSGASQADLIQVNGKSYPQAKLLLGQMGALHPANRLAAYITGRLKPGQYNLTKFNETSSGLSSGILSPTLGGKDENWKESTSPAPAASKSDPLVLNKASSQLKPSSVFTQFVMNEVGALRQKTQAVGSSPTSPSPPKQSTSSSRLLLFASLVPNEPSPVTSSTTPPKMPKLTSPLLTSSNKVYLSTTSPSKDQEKSIPTLVKITTKDSVSSTPFLLAAKPCGQMSQTVASDTPSKPVVLLPPPPLLSPPVPKPLPAPPVLKPLPTSTVTTTTLPPALQVKNVAVPSSGSIRLGSVAPQVGDALPTLTLRPASQSNAPVSQGLEKRMGPRLLFIPVQSSPPTVRQVIRPPQPAGQKVVLQPIRNPGGGTSLFRHPNGQIIQLVPLQQIRGALVQPGSQQVVFRNPSSVIGVRLPFPSKTGTISASTSPHSAPVVSSTTTSSSLLSIKTGSVLGSVYKTSPAPTVVPVTPPSPSFLSQVGTLRFRIAPPASSSEAEQPNAKVITYSSVEQSGNPPNVVSLQSGTFALINVPTSSAPPSSNGKDSEASQTNDMSTKMDGASEAKMDGASEAKMDGASEAKMDGASEAKMDGASEAKMDGASEAKMDGASEAKMDGASEAKMDGASEAKMDGASEAKMDGASEAKMDGASEAKMDGASEAKMDGASEAKMDGASEAVKDEAPDVKTGDSTEVDKAEVKMGDSCKASEVEIGDATEVEKDEAPEEEMGDASEAVKGEASEVKTGVGTPEAEKGDASGAEKGNASEQTKADDPLAHSADSTASDNNVEKVDLECLEAPASECLEAPASECLEAPASECPEAPASECPEAPASECPEAPASECPEAPASECPEAPASECPEAPASECPEAPASECPEAPASESEEADKLAVTEVKTSEETGENVSVSLELKCSTKLGVSRSDASDHEQQNTENPKGASGQGELSSQTRNSDLLQEHVEAEHTSDPKPAEPSALPQDTVTDAESLTETSLLEPVSHSSDALTESVLCSTTNSTGENPETNTTPKASQSDPQKQSESLSEPPIATGEAADAAQKYPDIIDCTQSDSQSDDCNSDVEEAVDIETVEELSEKINIARLKATACKPYLDKASAHADLLRRRKGLKKGGPLFLREEDEDPSSYHRRTHTANERRRRNEMRDLFEELKNALGLHNLPKVSKSYILKQAIEEIEGLTDEADTLIRKKTVLSQKQNQLIKKVSNMSGRPKEVIIKKLEYIDAKQKAIEAERRKKQLEEEMALHKASLMCSTSNRIPFQTLKPVENSLTANSKTKRPLILRKQITLPVEASASQSHVSVTSSILEASHGGQPAVAINSQPQIHPGLITVQIQLPVTMQANQFPARVIVPDCKVLPPAEDSEKDDLSMMPKIVNVTSLASENMIDLDVDLESTTLIDQSGKDVARFPTDAAVTKGKEPNQDSMSVNTPQELETAATETNPDLPPLPSIAQETSSPGSVDNLLKEDYSKEGMAAGCEDMNLKPAPVSDISKVDMVARPNLEFKQVASQVDDPVLDPNSLIDVIGDHEDENLTSLLDEIAFLNQQLSNDTDDLDSGTDFPGSDTTSRGSASKLLDGDASPFSFGPFKELSGMKEKVSLSPLFLQLEEGEIQEDLKLKEGASATTLEPISKPAPLPDLAEHDLGLQEEKAAKPELSGCDSWWRPMPKLAPLGLKAATLSSGQNAVASKAMPALAPIAKRLKSPLTAEGQSKASSADPTLASNTEN